MWRSRPKFSDSERAHGSSVMVFRPRSITGRLRCGVEFQPGPTSRVLFGGCCCFLLGGVFWGLAISRDDDAAALEASGGRRDGECADELDIMANNSVTSSVSLSAPVGADAEAGLSSVAAAGMTTAAGVDRATPGGFHESGRPTSCCHPALRSSTADEVPSIITNFRIASTHYGNRNGHIVSLETASSFSSFPRFL